MVLSLKTWGEKFGFWMRSSVYPLSPVIRLQYVMAAENETKTDGDH